MLLDIIYKFIVVCIAKNKSDITIIGMLDFYIDVIKLLLCTSARVYM